MRRSSRSKIDSRARFALLLDVTPLSTTETQLIVSPAGTPETVMVLVEVLIVPAATDTPPVEV
jgi:hypothetical protein